MSLKRKGTLAFVALCTASAIASPAALADTDTTASPETDSSQPAASASVEQERQDQATPSDEQSSGQETSDAVETAPLDSEQSDDSDASDESDSSTSASEETLAANEIDATDTNGAADEIDATDTNGDANDSDGEQSTTQTLSVAATSVSHTLMASATSVSLAAADAPAASIQTGVATTISSSINTNKVVDVAGASTANGANIQIYDANTTAAQRWVLYYHDDSATYEIVNAVSGKALDIPGAKAYSGQVVQLYTRNGTLAQRWYAISAGGTYYRFASALDTSLFLDLKAASTANSTRLQLWTGNGTQAQLWSVSPVVQTVADGYYVIANTKSNMALDVSGASTANSANVWQYDQNGTMAQVWKVSFNAATGYYTLLSANSGKALDVKGASSTNGANVQQYTSNGTKAQLWTISLNTDGSFTILSATGGKALDVNGASTSAQANVQIYTANGTGAQKWSFTRLDHVVAEGAYLISAGVGSNKVLDVRGGNTAAGTNVDIYSQNGTNAQAWYIRPGTADQTYYIQNPYSGLYLNYASAVSGANVQLGTTAQLWTISFDTAGMHITPYGTTLALDVAGANAADYTNVQIYQSNGTPAQAFRLTSTDALSTGYYRFSTDLNNTYVIDVSGASRTAGTQVQIYENNDTNAQKFALAEVATNTYRIVNINSGMALTASSTTSGAAITQQTVSSSTLQQWRIIVQAGGSLGFALVANPNVALAVSSANALDSIPLTTASRSSSASQGWDPEALSSVTSNTTVSLSLTLSQMVALQRQGNPWISDYTDSNILNALDPSRQDQLEFADLRTVSTVTAAQINSFLNSTSSGRSGIFAGQGSAFINAAAKAGIDAVYLLAHAIWETGWGTSTLAQGYSYNGSTYYNFFGYGAFDADAVGNGTAYAVQAGWNSIANALTGGANIIADSYMYADTYPQYTLYSMKWDYDRTNATGSYGWHQYATDPNWAAHIAELMQEFYDYTGAAASYSYVTPVYR